MIFRLAMLGLTLALLGGMASAKEDPPGPEDERLPGTEPPAAAVKRLIAAHEASDPQAFDALVARPSPSRISMAAVLLNPPRREATAVEQAVLRRLVERAAPETGVADYVAYWESASDETRTAERERWRLSARFIMRLRRGKVEEALAVLKPELAGLRAARYSDQAANILANHGFHLVRTGAYVEAERELGALLNTLRAERRQHVQPLVMAWYARALLGLSRRGDAVRVLEATHQLSERLRMWGPAARAAREHGMIATQLGDFAAADTALRKSLAIAGALKQSDLAHQCRLAMASLERARGRLDLADIHAARVFAATQTAPQPDRAVDAASRLLRDRLRSGRSADAVFHGAWIEDHLDKVRDPEILGLAHKALAALATWRRTPADARVHLEAALVAFGDAPSWQRQKLGTLSALLGLDGLTGSTRELRVAQYRRLVEVEAEGAQAAAILADAAMHERHAGNLVQALVFADRALAATRGSPQDPAQHRALAERAYVHQAQGDPAQASALFSRALAVMPKRSAHEPRYQLALAQSLLAAGRPEAAVSAARRALIAAAQIRAGVVQFDAVRVRSREHAAAGVGIQAALAWKRAGDPAAASAALEAAWWFREQATGRLLSEALRGPRAPAPESRRRSLGAALDVVEATQRKLIIAIARGRSKQVQVLRTALDAGYRTLGAVRRRSEPAASPAVFKPTSLAEVQRRLTDEDALLAYLVTEDVVYGLSVDAAGMTLKVLGKAAEITDLIARWKTLASTPDGPDQKLAARLHDMLIAPLAARLTPHRRWLVLPDGPLSDVPIDAWIRTTDGKRERLIQRHAITFAHADTVRAALASRAARRAPAQGVIAMGDPGYPAIEPGAQAPPTGKLLARLRGGLALPRLPASGAEARDVAALFPASERTTLLGDKASQRGFLASLTGRDVPLRAIHLACHGIIDDVHPTLSGLVFAGGDVLTAERIQSLRVDADLVVLSACDSGAGEHAVGEGVLGLTRALFLAGASRVVCSNWQVADDSTATLMVRLHEGRERDGLSTGAALRRARRSLLDAPSTAHPFYWAGFQLWGADTAAAGR